MILRIFFIHLFSTYERYFVYLQKIETNQAEKYKLKSTFIANWEIQIQTLLTLELDLQSQQLWKSSWEKIGEFL